MAPEDSTPPEVAAWFDGMVAEYSAPERIAEGLAGVRLTVARRRTARRLVADSRGVAGRLALLAVARYFRAEERGELTLREVSLRTGIPLTDTRAALRAFVDARILSERVEAAASNDLPPTRFYRLVEGGGTLLAEIVVHAEEPTRLGVAQPVETLRWESR
ncbi:hypothetical protein [Actinokineospora globicatena]|uniref:Uncharacterized protein n=1 Tax=Actinokineospora globicatena TaxID=103729 RepID=A0A9W6QL33_9PSEU|nr:hypothetical protein [Actinokineospora globicatena]GLW91620.1 hypothetical protein Aglo03_24360 [Actinokineospora globicatena]